MESESNRERLARLYEDLIGLLRAKTKTNDEEKIREIEQTIEAVKEEIALIEKELAVTEINNSDVENFLRFIARNFKHNLVRKDRLAKVLYMALNKKSLLYNFIARDYITNFLSILKDFNIITWENETYIAINTFLIQKYKRI